MLMFTNRAVTASTTPSAFTRRFLPESDALSAVQVTRHGKGFALADLVAGVDDDAALNLLVPLFKGRRPVLVYLHGFNNPPGVCFERCALLEETFNLEVVGFSWPSEGYLSSGADQPNLPAGPDDDGEDSFAKINSKNASEGWVKRKKRRYLQAKMNALGSTDALARLVRLVATARLYAHHQPMTLAAHSLGCHLLQYTIENEGAAGSLGVAHNIALIAACCRAAGHETWVRRLTPVGRVYVTYNKGDSVLFGAAIVDGHQVKLGTEPGTRLVSSSVRYVSCTNAQVGLGGHGYFVPAAGESLPKDFRKLFKRILGSERDVRDDQGEEPRKVYPLGCDADGATCYMANPNP